MNVSLSSHAPKAQSRHLCPTTVALILLGISVACTHPARAATVTGTVVDELQQPVRGAIVYAGTRGMPLLMQNNAILTGERHPRTITDEEGRFSLDLAETTGAVALARDLDDRTGFAPAQPGNDITVVIARPAAVEPVLPHIALMEGEDLVLAALTPPGLRYSFSRTSRQKGPYVIENLVPGDYVLETTHQVPQVGCCFKKVTTRQVTTTLTPGTKQQVQLGGRDMPFVQGRVTDTDGEGLHGVWIRLIPGDGVSIPIVSTRVASDAETPPPRVWSSVTTRDGTYQIDDVMPGEYTLRAFRRLAQNSSSYTLEVVEKIVVPKMAPVRRVPYTRDLTVDLSAFAPLSAGAIAPEIDAPTLTDTPFRLSDLRGKLVVLHFYAAWCQPCVDTIGEYNALASQYADGSVTVVGISLDESKEEAKAFAEGRALNHPIIYQGSWSQNAIRESYRVNAIPYTVIVGPDGTVTGQNIHGTLLREEVARQHAQGASQ